MRMMLPGLAAAALLGTTAGVAQAQDTQSSPPATTPTLPTQPVPEELPPIDPRLDPDGPATTAPTTTEPVMTEPMEPAAPVGTVPPAPPPDSEEGTDVLDDNDVGPDDAVVPTPEEGEADTHVDHALEPDPTQPPL